MLDPWILLERIVAADAALALDDSDDAVNAMISTVRQARRALALHRRST